MPTYRDLDCQLTLRLVFQLAFPGARSCYKQDLTRWPLLHLLPHITRIRLHQDSK